MQGAAPIRRQGITAHTHPAIQQGHRVNDKGDTTHTDGDTNIRRGVQQHSRPSLTMPPTIHHATHHPQPPHPPPL